MRFDPDAFGIVDVLHNNAVAGAAALAGACPRLLAMRRFAPLYEGRPSTLSPAVLIRSGVLAEGTSQPDASWALMAHQHCMQASSRAAAWLE